MKDRCFVGARQFAAGVAIAVAVLSGCRSASVCGELDEFDLLSSGGVRLGEKTDRAWSSVRGVSVDPASGRVAQISHQWDGLDETRSREVFNALVAFVEGIDGGIREEDSDGRVRYVVRGEDGGERTYIVSAFPSGGGDGHRVKFVCFDRDLLLAFRRARRIASAVRDERPAGRRTKTVRYVVGENEDVITLAIEFFVNPHDIRVWNGIPDDGGLEPGQEILLKIPIR